MITHFGINNRDQIQFFQKELLQKNISQNSKIDHRMSTEKLGKNFSAFLYEKNDKKLLVLLDIDDGSGGTPSDCKIVWPTLFELQQTYKPHDMMILKSQVHPNPEYNQFYPFKEDVFPIGMFSNDPHKTLVMKDRYCKVDVEKDIDVFYAGGYKHIKNRPYVWPKNRDIKKWWSGASIRGYKKLLEIKDKRPDINFALFDDVLPPEQFYSLMNRSKICIDLPGVGLSSRKFYECLVFGKCIIALRQQYSLWPCEENVHYCSLGEDLDFESLESKIDLLLNNSQMRLNIEKNVSSISSLLSMESIVKNVEFLIQQKLDSVDSFLIQY